MSHRPFSLSVLAVSLALAACGDDTPTQPNTIANQHPSAPQLAVVSNTWLTRANMWGAERRDLAATSLTNAAGQSILYAIGGRSMAGGPLGKVMAYNVATNSWTEKASLPIPLWGTSGAAVVKGKIYVAGGCQVVECAIDGPSERLFVYDPATNTWTRKRDLPFTIDHHHPFPAGRGVSGVIAGKLYVVSDCWFVPESDYYYADCSPSFFTRYNPVTDQWTSLPRPSGSYTIGGVIGGTFYVAKGTRVEVYDPATNLWRTKARLSSSLGGFGAVMLSKLYTVNGTQFRIYDASTNTVTTKASLPTDRGIAAAVKVFLNGQPRLEVVGGTRPGNNLQYTP